MIDRIFSAALTFGLLAGGTIAVGSELLGHERPPTRVAHLSAVRLAPAQAGGKRLAPAATLAAAVRTEAAPRVQ